MSDPPPHLLPHAPQKKRALPGPQPSALCPTVSKLFEGGRVCPVHCILSPVPGQRVTTVYGLLTSELELWYRKEGWAV